MSEQLLLIDGRAVDRIGEEIEDESLAAITITDAVQRLTTNELRDLANDCLRVLEPNGVLSLTALDTASVISAYWECREQESIALSNEPMSPLHWLDGKLFGDSHRLLIYQEKLEQIFDQFKTHSFERQAPDYLYMTCRKPEHPRASVVLSTRNKADYLDATLASIFRQHPPFAFEVIVVDDGSTDHTRAVCHKYPVRCRYLENPRYRNPSVARNVAYRAARGEVLICQSDDVVHVTPDAIEKLVTDLKSGEFLLAHTDNWQYEGGKPKTFIREYCGSYWQKPYFFLGSIRRADMYAVGGCDEEFIEPCWDDNWLADCLMYGAGLKPCWTKRVEAHHQSHPHYQDNPTEKSVAYGKTTHGREQVSKELYERKVTQARHTGVYMSSGGPWGLASGKPLCAAAAPLQFAMTIAAPPRQWRVKIPQRMSFFWTGDKLSWMRYATLASFRRWHPSWQIVVYWMTETAGNKTWKSSETQDIQIYTGPDYSDRLAVLDVLLVQWVPPREGLAAAHACDFCQWESLAGEGGWYADMDVLWTRALPSAKNADAVFCLSEGFMAIGLMAASAGNALFKDARTIADRNYTPERYQSTGAEVLYRMADVWPNWGNYNRPGDLALSRLREQHRGLQITQLPDHTVYPFTYRQTALIFSEQHPLPKDCCGIHWFGGNNLSQEWNSLLTKENYQQYENTYTATAKWVFAP